MIVAGTGHRPDKLGGYSWHAHDRLVRAAIMALETLRPSSAITGMALGWDQALAAACLRTGVPYRAYVPFAGQESRWQADAQRDYRRLLAAAYDVRICSEGAFSASKMQRRNEMIVDDCDLVLACWDGSPGGTGNCVRYADQIARPLWNVYGLWLTVSH